MSNKQSAAHRLADWLSAFKSTIADEAAAELRRLSTIEVELELTRQTHLSVVQRLQAEIDKLKREAEKDAKHEAWLNRAADERAEADARAYNCGEL